MAIVKYKKGLFILGGVAIVLLLLFTVTPLQYFHLTLDGQPGMSKSIEESKERKVFLYEYSINGGGINIKKAWVERAWQYTGYFTNNTKPYSDGYQICLITDKETLKDYDSWTIATSYGDAFTTPWGTTNNPEPYLQGFYKAIPATTEELIIKRKGAITGQVTLTKQ